MGQGDQLYTIKVIGSEETNNTFILATAVIDANTGKSENQEVVATANSSVLNINVRATYKDFQNKIQNIVYTGKQLKNITKNLQDHTKRSFHSEGFLEEMIHYVETKDNSKLSYLFEQIFTKAAGIGSYSIQVSSDKITRADIEKTTMAVEGAEPTSDIQLEDGSGSANPSGSGPVVSDIPPGAKVVQFKFLLSPVSGTAVTDLYPGSPVVVRLNQSDPSTNDTITSMNLRGEDGAVKPLPCTIHKITHKNNESEVIVKINDNLFGKYLEEENTVKVKTSMVEPKSRIQAHPQTQNVDKNIEALRNDNSLFYYIMAIAALIAIGVFIVVFLA